jgi:hypothetical protein
MDNQNQAAGNLKSVPQKRGFPAVVVSGTLLQVPPEFYTIRRVIPIAVCAVWAENVKR